MHVESVYLPRSISGSGLALRSASDLLPALDAPHAWDSPTPARTMRGTGAEEFNVGQFLVDRTSPVQSPAEAGINQYGSMFQHVAIHQRDSSDEDDTPPHRDAGRQRPSPRVSPVRQPSPMDKDIER